MLLLRVIAAHLITYIPTYSEICLKIILYLSDRCSVLLSNKFSDISPHINYSDMLFDGLFHILQVSGNPSGILSDILSDKYSDIVSDILFDIYSDTFPDILFDTLPGSLSDDSDGFSGSLYL